MVAEASLAGRDGVWGGTARLRCLPRHTRRAVARRTASTPAGNLLRGLVSCTGAQFCPLALIETKGRALEVVRELEAQLDVPAMVRMHWTGCPNSCGQVGSRRWFCSRATCSARLPYSWRRCAKRVRTEHRRQRCPARAPG